MRPPPAVNDNAERVRTPGKPARVPDQLEMEIARLHLLAERANLDALAVILAMAGREASRVATWERRVIAEINAC